MTPALLAGSGGDHPMQRLLGVRSRLPRRQPLEGATARSIAHAFGLLGPDDPVDVELEQSLLTDLHRAGIDIHELEVAHKNLAKEDRDKLQLLTVRKAFEDALNAHTHLVGQASLRIDHNFKRADEVRLNLLRQAQAVLLLFDSFENHLTAGVDAVDRQMKTVDVRCQALDTKLQKIDQMAFDVEERGNALRESVREAGATVRGSGPAAQRLAFIGAIYGAAIGGMVAFALLFSALVLLD